MGSIRFEILESKPVPGEFVLVSPDVATCKECWLDVTDPTNRRYGYPFTNCTNCWPAIHHHPRHTIRPTDDDDGQIPHVPGCEAEYHDPRNRRFHAQPNACPVCGPSRVGKERIVSADERSFRIRCRPFQFWRRRGQFAAAGEIIAIKGLGGFHLACDAENDEAVRRLRQRKKRSDKPFALMARDIAVVETICE